MQTFFALCHDHGRKFCDVKGFRKAKRASSWNPLAALARTVIFFSKPKTQNPNLGSLTAGCGNRAVAAFRHMAMVQAGPNNLMVGVVSVPANFKIGVQQP